MLALYVNTYHTGWDEYVDYVAFAYNTSRHETSGMTPFFALYGREAMLPLDVSLGSDPNSTSREIAIPSIEKNRSRFDNLHEIVKRRMLVAHARQKKHYNRKRTEKVCYVGDAVLVYRPLRKKGRAEKLLFRYHGSYKIVGRTNSLNYIVKPMYGSKEKEELCPCLQLKAIH